MNEIFETMGQTLSDGMSGKYEMNDEKRVSLVKRLNSREGVQALIFVILNKQKKDGCFF